MEGKINFKKNIKKDTLLMILGLENGVSGKVYIVQGFRNEKNWDFKVGQRVGGLVWFNEKEKIIDADSPVYPLD